LRTKGAQSSNTHDKANIFLRLGLIAHQRLLPLPPTLGWLPGWLAGWLVNWLVGWLDGWLALPAFLPWLAGCLAGWLAGWIDMDTLLKLLKPRPGFLSNSCSPDRQQYLELYY